MANYHQHFNFDKFTKTIDSKLFKEYFSRNKITLPEHININDSNSVRNLIKTQEEIKRLEIDEELQRIHDISERQMERLHDICQRFNIKNEDGEPPETTAMRVFLHENNEVFDEVYDYYLYDIYVERLYHYRFDGTKISFSGKSDDCFIRKGVDGDKYFFIIARGDCVKTQLEFLNKRIIPRSFRPAKQDMVVFQIVINPPGYMSIWGQTPRSS